VSVSGIGRDCAQRSVRVGGHGQKWSGRRTGGGRCGLGKLVRGVRAVVRGAGTVRDCRSGERVVMVVVVWHRRGIVEGVGKVMVPMRDGLRKGICRKDLVLERRDCRCG